MIDRVEAIATRPAIANGIAFRVAARGTLGPRAAAAAERVVTPAGGHRPGIRDALPRVATNGEGDRCVRNAERRRHVEHPAAVHRAIAREQSRQCDVDLGELRLGMVFALIAVHDRFLARFAIERSGSAGVSCTFFDHSTRLISFSS